jgi:tetratricopeptide (TPR) repeat protein
MSKKRRYVRQKLAHNQITQPSVSSPPTAPHTPTTAYEQGLREFRAKRYKQAITVWQQVPQPENVLNKALAEAHFRLGVGASATSTLQSEESLTHIRQAVDLAPADPVYAYHLGLGLHREGRSSEARDCYRRAVSNGLARRGSGVVMALAELELDLHSDVKTLPGVSADDLKVLAPVLSVLGKNTEPRPRRCGSHSVYAHSQQQFADQLPKMYSTH